MSDSSSLREFRWQALFQRATDPVFVLDRRCRLLFVNLAWQRLVELTLNQARGLVCRRPQAITPGDSLEERIAHVLTPPVETHEGKFTRVRRLFVAATRPQPQWWDVEFLPFRLKDASEGHLTLGRILPLAVELSVPLRLVPERLEELRLKRFEKFTFSLLDGNRVAIRRLAEQTRLASRVDAPTLIRGETGSGKRTIARIIHVQGTRRESAFVTLDSRRLPHSVLSRLIGIHRAGSGTLYLAEPALLPRELQREIAGWLAVERPNTPRMLAGASTLDGLIDELHWRLSTLTLEIPPLRERLDELPKFVERFGSRPLTSAGLEAMQAYAWPGNLGELRRILALANERAVGERIDLADLPMQMREARLLEIDSNSTPNSLPLEQTLARVEERLIRLALRRSRGNRSRAAELLGIHRPRLLRRIDSLGIDVPEEGG